MTAQNLPFPVEGVHFIRRIYTYSHGLADANMYE